MNGVTIGRGVWGVVATPFMGSRAEIDHESLAGLVSHYEAVGARGLTVLGVFGEAASLTRAERADVLATVVAATRLPIIAGVTALSTRPAIDEVVDIQEVVGDRLAGAMVQLNTADAAALSTHLSAISEATGVGIVAQNYPVASGVNIDPASEVEALRSAAGLVAVKAEAAPTAQRIAILTEQFSVPVFGGLGGIALIDELSLGAAGAMTGFSYPEGLIETVAAFDAGGFDEARTALMPYLPLINFEQQPGIALAIRKHCLVQRGLIREAAVRSPGRALPPVLAEQIDRHIRAVESFRAGVEARGAVS